MRRARRFFRNHGGAMKETGIQAGGGLAVALLDKQVLSTESGQKMLGDNTYLKPILVGVVAHFVKQKAPSLGAGMAGAAGYMLGQAYYENQEAESETKGLVEAGSLHHQPRAFAMPRANMYADAGAVFEVVPG